MTEPRFIPAEEAKTMMEGSQEQHEWWPDVLTPVEESAHDLAHTVIAQAAQIKRLQESLREAMEDSKEDLEIGRAHYPEDYCTGRIQAFAMALRLIEEMQGDTDD